MKGSKRTFIKTIDEISCGENVLVSFRYSTCTIGFPPWSTTLKGHDSISFFTVGSSNRRPIRRLRKGLAITLHKYFSQKSLLEVAYLISKIVLAGFIAA